MSLRRSQPCDCAVAYSNWIMVEIILLPGRLLKSPSVSGFSRSPPSADQWGVQGGADFRVEDNKVGVKYALNWIFVQSEAGFHDW